MVWIMSLLLLLLLIQIRGTKRVNCKNGTFVRTMKLLKWYEKHLRVDSKLFKNTLDVLLNWLWPSFNNWVNCSWLNCEPGNVCNSIVALPCTPSVEVLLLLVTPLTTCRLPRITIVILIKMTVVHLAPWNIGVFAVNKLLIIWWHKIEW